MNILIADDHHLVRSTLSQVLEARGHTVIQVSDFPSALEIALAGDSILDAVFLDLRMPGMDGVSGLACLLQHCPKLTVALISACEEPAMAARARDLGAAGYVPKAWPMLRVADAIDDIVGGKRIYPIL